MELKLFGENYRVTAATMTGRRSENQDCYSLTATSTGTLRGNIMGEEFGPEITDDRDLLFSRRSATVSGDGGTGTSRARSSQAVWRDGPHRPQGRWTE